MDLLSLVPYRPAGQCPSDDHQLLKEVASRTSTLQVHQEGIYTCVYRQCLVLSLSSLFNFLSSYSMEHFLAILPQSSVYSLIILEDVSSLYVVNRLCG